jgi:ketosteroid isomerase-like protein
MDPNEQIISNFYHSFQRLDAQGMNSCYSDDIVFFDPVFELLQADQARAMWRMLCGYAKDFSLTYGNIKALDEEYYTCDWVATYTFSQTGKRVVNNVKAHMKMLDGKIVEHSDGFSLHKWSTQALGFPGWLLGWNSFFQRKIKNNARKKLLQYMQTEAE